MHYDEHKDEYDGIRIGTIGNEYGDLRVEEREGEYFWWIEGALDRYEQRISADLYQALLAFRAKYARIKTE